MDGNNKKSFWWAIVGTIVILSCFLLGSWVTNKKWEKRLNQAGELVKGLEKQRDSLLKVTEKLDEQINVLTDPLGKKKEEIVYIKIQGDEKVDSIRTLPIDSAIEFLSRELSKEASTTR